jgi:hypothetical protein
MMRMRYHYVTLSYQKSLGADRSQAFAVLVEVHSHRQRRVYVVGRRINGDERTIIGEVLNRLPEILRERITELLTESAEAGDLAIARIRSEFVGNIHAAEPKAGRSFLLPLATVANGLFKQHVLPDPKRAEPHGEAHGRFAFPIATPA